MNTSHEGKKNYSELEIQYAWNHLMPGISLTCTNDSKIEVLYPGRWNFEGGPDFLNAKLKINGVEVYGDIEIHNIPSDWFVHRHNYDPKYSKVILHVVRPYSSVNTKSARLLAIPTVIFPDSYITTIKKDIEITKYAIGLCAEGLVKQLNPLQYNRFLCNFGRNRFSKKSIIFINEILTNGAEHTLLLHLFEAVGYKDNRQSFMDLYNRISRYEVSSYSNIVFESIIWGEAGFLDLEDCFKYDDKMQGYTSYLWSYWWRLKKDIRDLPKVTWAKFTGRPCNTPWRRVAGLIILLRKLEFLPVTKLLTVIRQDLNVKKIINELIDIFACNDETLAQYSNFNKKLKTSSLLIGRSRAIEIIGNIIVPFIYGYSKINKDTMLEERALEIWNKLPISRSNNIALRISFERWGIHRNAIKKPIKTFAAEQGVIFIYKNLCEYLHMNCKECPIFNRTL